MKCPQCQVDNGAQAAFCQRCGFNFQAQQQTQQQAPPTTKNKLSTPLIVIGVVVGVCGLCGIIGGIGAIIQKNQPAQIAQTNTNVGNTTPSTTIEAKPTVTAKATPALQKDASGVTIENFNKLKTGMKYEDVVKILGSEGTVISESEVAGYKTVMYQWKGGYVANMNCMFQNGKMMSKAQFGL